MVGDHIAAEVRLVHAGQTVTRRSFIGTAASCGAHMMFIASGLPRSAERFVGTASGQVVAEEPWGRLERVGEGLWALISTPLDGDRTTLCNGGIVAGTAGLMVVESFASPDGARWMAEQARTLTGKWPSHVVLTHFHGDHTGGIAGFAREETPRVLATTVTRNLVQHSDALRDRDAGSLKARMLADVAIVNPVSATKIDLGGRTVQIMPRVGHTPSDLTIEVNDPSVVWCGDLVWNRMFPNYTDAIPSRLSRDVRALVREAGTTYVPGHGPLADSSDLERFIEVIDTVEVAARDAFDRGISAEQAAREFRLPDSLGEWIMFSPRYYEVALSAWERDLSNS
jgi:glyoxylase-like metal-dependent hydrolase (beta-lactamase superfamily II)